MTWRFLLGRVSGFVPLLMSLAALGIVARALASGVTEVADEGTFTHLWQLLVVGQAPIIGWFVVRWLAVAPRAGATVVAVQLMAIAIALTPVFALHL